MLHQSLCSNTRPQSFYFTEVCPNLFSVEYIANIVPHCGEAEYTG